MNRALTAALTWFVLLANSWHYQRTSERVRLPKWNDIHVLQWHTINETQVKGWNRFFRTFFLCKQNWSVIGQFLSHTNDLLIGSLSTVIFGFTLSAVYQLCNTFHFIVVTCMSGIQALYSVVVFVVIRYTRRVNHAWHSTVKLSIALNYYAQLERCPFDFYSRLLIILLLTSGPDRSHFINKKFPGQMSIFTRIFSN